jgi:hypothetical protein
MGILIKMMTLKIITKHAVQEMGGTEERYLFQALCITKEN